MLAFGPDGKLYIFIGDVGRRGQLQNLPNGPFGPGQPDDQFGGPQPEDAHLTGVILRLNADGTTPSDNPFFAVGAGIPGEVGANIQKIFSYGHRNSFGMAIDTASRGAGNVWLQENGDDSFSELNRVTPGMNGGWVQIAGPVARIGQYKTIETTPPFVGLQQARWPPANIADTPEQALSRSGVLHNSIERCREFGVRLGRGIARIGFSLASTFEHDASRRCGTTCSAPARLHLRGGASVGCSAVGTARRQDSSQ